MDDDSAHLLRRNEVLVGQVVGLSRERARSFQEIYSFSLRPSLQTHYASSSSQISYLFLIHFARFHFRGEGMLSLVHHRECRLYRLSVLSPLQSIQYAILDDLCPMESSS